MAITAISQKIHSLAVRAVTARYVDGHVMSTSTNHHPSIKHAVTFSACIFGIMFLCCFKCRGDEKLFDTYFGGIQYGCHGQRQPYWKNTTIRISPQKIIRIEILIPNKVYCIPRKTIYACIERFFSKKNLNIFLLFFKLFLFLTAIF